MPMDPRKIEPPVPQGPMTIEQYEEMASDSIYEFDPRNINTVRDYNVSTPMERTQQRFDTGVTGAVTENWVTNEAYELGKTGRTKVAGIVPLDFTNYTPDPNFDAAAYAEGTIYAEAFEHFADAVNEEDFNERAKHFDKRLKDMAIGGKYPLTYFFGAIAGQVADPINAVPMFAAARAPMMFMKASRAANKARKIADAAYLAERTALSAKGLKGVDLYKAMGAARLEKAKVYAATSEALMQPASATAMIASGGLTGAAAGLLSESILQESNPLVQDADKFYTMAGGALLGAAFGGAVKYMGKADLQMYKDEMTVLAMGNTEAMNSVPFKVDADGVIKPDYDNSAGAASVDKYQRGVLNRQGELATKIVSYGQRWLLPPKVKAAISKNPVFRKFASVLHNTGLTVEGDVQKGIPAEMRIAEDEWASIQDLKAADTAFAQFKKDNRGLNRQAFEREVALTQLNMEENPQFRHSDPSVQRLAEYQQKNVYQKRAADFSARKLAEFEPGTIYYPHNFVKERWTTLDSRTIDHIAEEWFSWDQSLNGPKIHADIESVKARLAEIRDNIRTRRWNQLDNTGLNAIVGLDENMEAIKPVKAAQGDSPKGQGRDFLKKRDRSIPGHILGKYDLLDLAATQVAHGYSMKASRMVHMRDALDRLGAANFDTLRADFATYTTSHLNRIDNELQAQIDARNAKTPLTPKQMEKALQDKAKVLKKEAALLENDAEEMENMFKSFMGSLAEYTKADEYLGPVKALAAVAMLGKAVTYNISEFVSPIYRHGVRRWMTKGLKGLFQSAKDLEGKVPKDAGTLRFLNHHGMALDLYNSAMVKMFMDPGTGQYNAKDVGTLSNYAVGIYSKMTGLSYANTGLKVIAAQTTFGTMMEIMTSKAPSEADIEWLRQLGIQPDDYAKVIAQMDKAGGGKIDYKGNSTYISKLDDWEDLELKDRMVNAIMNDVDSVVMNPKPSDIPTVFVRGTFGRMAAQFRSFQFAANSRVRMSGMQRRNANVIMGVISFQITGYLAYVAKQAVMGEEIDTSFESFMVNGLANGPLLGFLGSQLVNAYLTDGAFTGNIFASNVLGPSGSYIAKGVDFMASAGIDATKFAKSGGQDPLLRSSTVHKLRGLGPTQNLIGVSHGWDALEDSLNQSLGNEPREKKKPAKEK